MKKLKINKLLNKMNYLQFKIKLNQYLIFKPVIMLCINNVMNNKLTN